MMGKLQPEPEPVFMFLKLERNNEMEAFIMGIT